MIAILNSVYYFPWVMLYSTIPILDSNGIRGPLVNLQPPMSSSVSGVQIFQCIHSLINQTATVDVQSHEIQSVEPDIHKSSSTWGPYAGPTNILTLANVFDMVITSNLHFKRRQ
jgi:hypothetical protein